MYAVNPSLPHLFTFFAGPFWLFLTFFLNLGIIRTTGRSEGKNLSNIRLDFWALTTFPSRTFEMIKLQQICFSKESNCLKNKIQKNCMQKSLKIKKINFILDVGQF